MKRLYIIRKYIEAASPAAALRIEKKRPADEIILHEQPSQELPAAMGFTIERSSDY